MNFKEITSSISEAENIPAGHARKAIKAFLGHVANAIENGDKLSLPGVIFNPITQPAREPQADKPALPERKAAVLKVRPQKQADN